MELLHLELLSLQLEAHQKGLQQAVPKFEKNPLFRAKSSLKPKKYLLTTSSRKTNNQDSDYYLLNNNEKKFLLFCSVVYHIYYYYLANSCDEIQRHDQKFTTSTTTNAIRERAFYLIAKLILIPFGNWIINFF